MPAVTPYRSDRPKDSPISKPVDTVKRVRIIYSLLLLLTTIFVIRLFYLQVIRHEYYQNAALQSQLKEYEVPAERGTILAHDGNLTAPLVLNEKKYTLFADPTFIKNPSKVAAAITAVIGGDAGKMESSLKKTGTRYVILAKKLNREQFKKLDDLDLSGVGTREESYRTYPQGSSSAQLLGFVNDEGKGQYGLEGYFNEELSGKVGYIKAITDLRGVPLAANPSNKIVEPKDGKDINLTIDVGMQRIAEEKLKEGLESTFSKSGNAVIIDTHSGAIKAMASYPTYDPSSFNLVTDPSLFRNSAVSDELEPGSIMKPLFIAAGLSASVIDTNFSYNNTDSVTIEGLTIKNSRHWGIPQENLQGIMQRSLNTGVVAVLKAAGGGEVNEKARDFWYDYMTNQFNFGKITGIEQSGEVAGSVPDPKNGYALNFQYANTSFGQGMTVNFIQMAAAAASVINGGTYYKPHIVESVGGQKRAVSAHQSAITKEASDEIVKIMVEVARTVYANSLHDGYIVGGKTGTAEIAGPDGKYSTDKANGTFFGFVGHTEPDYAVLVLTREPKTIRSAGIAAAEPIFASITKAMIDTGFVSTTR